MGPAIKPAPTDPLLRDIAKARVRFESAIADRQAKPGKDRITITIPGVRPEAAITAWEQITGLF